MMEIKRIGKISGGQDGAIYNGILFRFDHLGNGTATYLKDVQEDGETAPFATFALDKRELITPHSNAVFFGTEFYEEGKFGQELDPMDGKPSGGSEWYSSCMLFYVYAVRRLKIL